LNKAILCVIIKIATIDKNLNVRHLQKKLKQQYKIYNFDHGIDYPSKFSFGPFRIVIHDEHCKRVSEIPHDKTYTCSHDFSDSNFKRIIKKTPKIEGSWVETAIVEIDKTDIKESILYPHNDFETIDDLCLFLSFLTGRRVIQENKVDKCLFNPCRHSGRIVHKGFLSRSGVNWENLKNIKQRNLRVQFYNLSLGCECEELIAQGAYINSAFNGIYDEWFKKNKFRKILLKKTNGNLVPKSSRKELSANIKALVKEYFKEKQIHPILKFDFEKRLNELWSPTASTQIKLFIESMGLVYFYDNTTVEEKQKQKHLEWLSKVRNAFAHSGDIPKDKAYSRSMREDISLSIISIVLQIVQYYFASQVLKIEDPYLTYVKNKIIEYFNKGVFSDKKVFDETFEEYMNRTKKEWELY